MKLLKNGFTLVELIVVVTIIAIFASFSLVAINPLGQLNKTYDAQRQQDLSSIQSALDVYYNDHNCYPQTINFGQEWSQGSTVYMEKIPQDPTYSSQKQGYFYATDTTSNCPQWDVVFSKLAAPQLTTSNNTKCPLAPECTPQGYTNAWACKVSGQPNCSTLASASLPELVATAPSNPLQSLVSLIFPSATPAPIDCTSSLQSKINTAASGSTLDLTGCTFTGSYTISHPITLKGVTIKPSAGTSGITIASSNVTLDGVHIIGAQSNSFNSSENGVQVSGAISNLTIKNSEIAQFGQAGLWLASVTNLTIQNNQIHDTYYVGIMVLSGQGGNISNNLVQRIGMSNTTAGKTPDVGNNAYGIALSQINSTASTNFAVDSNTIEDVPTWHGLDTHGGTYINFTNNIVRRVSRAIFITTSVSRPNHINVTGNQFLSPSPVTFNLEAITTFSTDYVTITGNTIAGWNGNTIQDYNKLSTNLVVSGNTILSAGSVELSGNFLYH